MNGEKYKFLIKPALFIFNLVFASWLVLEIERMSPSDLGDYSSFFETNPRPILIPESGKQYLKKLGMDYKHGKIDSVHFEHEVEKFFKSLEEIVPERKK